MTKDDIQKELDAIRSIEDRDYALHRMEFLVRLGFAESNSRARQLLKDGTVSIGGNSVRDGVYLRDPKYLVWIYDGMVARLGKKSIKKYCVVRRDTLVVDSPSHHQDTP